MGTGEDSRRPLILSEIAPPNPEPQPRTLNPHSSGYRPLTRHGAHGPVSAAAHSITSPHTSCPGVSSPARIRLFQSKRATAQTPQHTPCTCDALSPSSAAFNLRALRSLRPRCDPHPHRCAHAPHGVPRTRAVLRPAGYDADVHILTLRYFCGAPSSCFAGPSTGPTSIGATLSAPPSACSGTSGALPPSPEST